MIGISSILLVAMIASVAVTCNRGSETKGEEGHVHNAQRNNVDMLCQSTQYQDTCKKSLQETYNKTKDIKDLIQAVFNVTAKELLNHIINNSTLYHELAKDNMTKQAMDICKEVLDYAVDGINKCIETLDTLELNKLSEHAYDLKVWLTGSLSHQQTCLDGFENTATNAGETMVKVMNTSLVLTSNALDIINEVSSFHKGLNLTTTTNRKLLFEVVSDDFPLWVSEGRRSLLQVGPGRV
ncbi:hypothetical protein VNO77_23640 [Canavalia gladiata]|uniref:Pectinesterase inhibitor domain-containing protein n=1 Tax=Canavalia gladiata TaxID=3824 RepID=A0AAN9L637_CANGL